MEMGFIRYGSIKGESDKQSSAIRSEVQVDDVLMSTINQLVLVMNVLNSLTNFEWTYLQNKKIRVRWTEL